MKKSFTVIYFADGDKKDTLKQLKKQCPSVQLIRVQADFPDQRNAEIGKALAKVKNDYFTVINEGDTLPDRLFECVDDAVGQVSQSGENALKQLRNLCPTAQLAKDQDGLYGSEQQVLAQIISKVRLHRSAVEVKSEDIFTKTEEMVRGYAHSMLISYNKNLDANVIPKAVRSCEMSDGSADGVVNLEDDPSSFPVTLNGTFVPAKKQILDMWEDKGLESEKNFLLKILLLNLSYYRINSAVYTYVNPADCHYELFQGVYYKEWYHEAITEFMIPIMISAKEQYHEIPRFLQYFAMYFIMCRLNANVDNRNKHVLEGEEAENYKDYLHKLLVHLDNSIIVCDRSEQKFYKRDTNLVRMFLQIKMNDYTLDFDYMFHGNHLSLTYDNYYLYNSNSLRVNVQFIEYEHQKWEMDLSVPSYYSRDKVKYYVKLDNILYPVRYSEAYSLTKYFGQSAYKRISFHASIPIKQNVKEQKLQFVMEYQGARYIIAPEYKSHTSRLTGAAKYAYWRFDRFIAYHSKNTIYIRKSKPLYTAYREVRLLGEMLSSKTPGIRNRALLRMAYHAMKPIYGKKKIWMFYDKIYKGGDSSEYIFKYASQFNDGIDKYYLIDKNCPDMKRLVSEGYKPLVRGSLKHRLIFLYADMMIVSNSTVFAFNDHSMQMSAYIRDLAKFHVACVQHGMSVQKIAIAQRRLRDNTRLYFCASKYEIENLSKPVYDYIGYDALKLTGGTDCPFNHHTYVIIAK